MSRPDGKLGSFVFISLLVAGCATGAPGGELGAEIYRDAVVECE